MRWWQRLQTGAIGMVASLGIAAVALAHAPAAGEARATPVQVTIGSATVTRPRAADFLGLAVEFGTIPDWSGWKPGTVNPLVVQLVRNLQPTGSPLLRIGGLSTDHTWWPVPHMAQPRGVTYDLSPHWVASARNLAAILHARLLPGIELQAARPRLSRLEASELVAGIGRKYLAGLEIGNEPELYTT